MNLKQRFTVLLSVLVAVTLIVTFIFIYVSQSNFRKESFYLRLEQKALITRQLLHEVEITDRELISAIDSNTLQTFLNEKVLIFDSANHILYSSIDNKIINWTPQLLDKIRAKRELRYEDGEDEVLALHLGPKERNDVIIIAAEDRSGRRKIADLRDTLIFAFVLGLIITGLLSYFYVRQVFTPLERLESQMKTIGEHNLRARIETQGGNNEISRLAESYNHMLSRLEQSFESQRNFVRAASHELRTPIATLITQTEIALSKDLAPNEYKQLLKSLNEDHRHLADITNSLLLLTRFENMSSRASESEIRIDETVIEAIEEVNQNNPDFSISFHFEDQPASASALTIHGDETLWRIALTNLIVNACTYSNNKSARVALATPDDHIRITVSNGGPVIPEEQRSKIFIPFYRGANSAGKKGHGLGLSIIKRIVELHGARISYHAGSEQPNVFTIII